MIRVLSMAGAWLFSSRFLTIAAIVGCYVFGIFGAGTWGDSALLAYDIDLQMDKARMEKTVEHYGEPIRDIVQQATENNENNPEHKSTAKNTYERESPLNDVLPERVGKDFSQKDLEDMEN